MFSQVWRIAKRYDTQKGRVDTWLFMLARSRILAPLYALGLLSQDDRAWVEAQIILEQDLATELTEIEAIVAAIPYGNPQIPMAANLKDRLFQRIGRDVPTTQTTQNSASSFPGLVARLLERSAMSLINRSEVRH